MAKLNNRSWVVAAGLSLALGAVDAGAAIISQYTFQAPSSNTSSPQAASTVDPSVTASSFTPFLNGAASASVDATTGMGFSGANKNAFLGSGTISLTAPGDDYWQFTVTPKATAAVTYSTFVFDTVAPNISGGSVVWDVRSSADAYAASLGTVTQSTANATTSGSIVDIASLGTQSGAITFRIYNSATAGTTFAAASQMRVDNVTVNGTIPEPTSLGLLAVGAVGLLARRRRA